LQKDFSNYEQRDFIPTFVPNLDDVSPKSKEACKGNEKCLFDLAVTGDEELAASTLESAESFEELTAIDGRASCKMPTKPENGYIEVKNLLEGSSVKLICNENYNVKGTSIVTCVKDLSEKLSWDGSLGTCADKCADIKNAYEKFLCEQGLNQG